MPKRKVVVGAIAGAVSTIGWWILVTAEPSIKPPVEVVGGSITLISLVLSYLIPEADQA